MQASANDVVASRTRSWKLSKWGAWALALCWVCMLFDIFSLLIIPISLSAVIQQSRHRAFRPLVLIFLLNPLSVFFIGGVVSYWRGAPRLHGGGWVSFHKLDRQTRCFRRVDRSCTGWTQSGWYESAPHNAAIKLMVAMFGYASNSYDGPYPTTAEALAIVTNAPPTPTDLLAVNKVLVDGKEVEISEGKMAWCLGLASILAGSRTNTVQQLPTVRATLQQERCLILYLSKAPDPESAVGCDVVVLFDYQKLRPFFYERYFPIVP